MSDSLGAWVTRTPRPEALRLVCVPFAGAGGSVFAPWVSKLPDVELCAVTPPGRWHRLREPLCRTMDEMVAGLVASITPEISTRPWVLFGHSLGAWVAFELLRVLAARGERLPEHFYASGRRAPHLPSELETVSLRELSDAELVAHVDRSYGGMDPRILANPELLAILVPILRADFEVVASYQHRSAPPLDVPITAIAGDSDPLIPENGLESWREHTRRAFATRRYPGGHFYLVDNTGPLLNELRGELATISKAARQRR